MITPQKFLGETRDELRQVVWPSRQELTRLTLVVILISAAVGIYIGGLDYLFAKAVQILVSLKK